jgi:uncharacterized membrane protein YraQ (UPF0718 family)
LFRRKLTPEVVKKYLSGKNRFWGYILATLLGIITPFCTCSGVPLFLGFIGAGVPFGICVAFILASSLVNEIAAFLLIGIAGFDVALIYVISGSLIAIIGAFFADRMRKEKIKTSKKIKYHEHHHNNTSKDCCCEHHHHKESILKYAHHMAIDTMRETWGYILAGLILASVMQGYIPENIIYETTNADNPWAVPFASLIGTLLYAPHGAVIPIFDALLQKGVPLGTSIVVLMSTTAISIPELAMIKKAASTKLLAIFVIYLLVAFNLLGYFLNIIY